jgi:preprotein translocase subunit SecE
MAYKKDQGRMARMAVFWCLAILFFWGCRSLNLQIAEWFPALRRPLGDFTIPVLGIDLSPAFLIAMVVFAIGIFALWRWSETPKIADLMIETELELRKVTWPTMPEVVNSSIVVIVCVAVLMVFLAGSDFILGRIASRLLFN